MVYRDFKVEGNVKLVELRRNIRSYNAMFAPKNRSVINYYEFLVRVFETILRGNNVKANIKDKGISIFVEKNDKVYSNERRSNLDVRSCV